MTLICPICNSNNIVKNGKSNNKQQFKCKECNKFFSYNTLKGFPKTSYPFPYIAYVIYKKRQYEEIEYELPPKCFHNFLFHLQYECGIKRLPSNRMRQKKQLPPEYKQISRQTYHTWYKNYNENLEEIISREEAKKFVDKLSNETDLHNLKSRPIEKPPKEEYIDYEMVKFRIKRKDALKKFVEYFGKEKVMSLLKNDVKAFNEILEMLHYDYHYDIVFYD